MPSEPGIQYIQATEQDAMPLPPTTLVCTLSPITSRTLKSPIEMEHFTLSTVLVVALLLSTGLVRSLPVDTGDDLGTIIFSSVLFRHGDRAPTGAYPNDIYNEEAKYWPRGYGQLSNIGEEQHFKQGSFFRKRYNHILPETYNVNDTYVRSSNIDRTLASARAHLAGPLLKEIIANTQAKVNGTLSPDRGLYIYSAHDNNVVDLLQGLDVFNGILVPYASAVMIELRNKSDEYFITRPGRDDQVTSVAVA
uniref:acid phosphatase n=1 Tax=Timema bartmani TaxID=61472 RepID=A0A7R9F081_9NEOP|nr:unnamed protein product [Timema bartmani]